MSARTTLVLSRHGRTVWHEENRYAGSSDVDLDDVGRRQAAELAAWVSRHPPSALACSPLQRARDTAAASATAASLEVVVVDDLREVHFGVAEGCTLAELEARAPQMVQRFRADPVRSHFPDGEPPGEAADRGAAALRRLAAAHPGGTVLVVAHNTLLRLALCRLLDIDVRRYRDVFPRLDNGALSEVAVPAVGGGPVALRSLNVPLGAGRAS